MALAVNNNIPALQMYNTVNATGTSLQKSTQNPSTGLRIDSAAGDAAEQLPPVSDTEAANAVPELDKESQKKALSQTAALLSVFDRKLKYEVLEDARVVQIQVIDTNDGRVVRKIPADEIIKLIKAMKEKIDDRVDVLV